ncbi:MAG: Dipeptide-binding ABC transporter, periplasmic substrate-binding component [uncultured Thermomicrobiales bacterium]|uniref:Dipeptide-binding ABC transporter, periplasmic substrate-binding component n=1 Tax=uncultured Thermomicrobiales bacterium TaxID=1645740 RepID=A0A6J4UQG0_9BACT|nr:MAG: Dipeptide-binding ABC transporter, periplasmic substrate-binding component [uncultured Thermomicrobiales bacterium]
MSQRQRPDERGTTPFTEFIRPPGVSRRALVRAGVAGAAGIAAAGTLVPRGAGAKPGPASARPALLRQEAGQGQPGGTLRVATTGQPAGLDMHLVNQRTITLIGWNMYEALFTFDADYATVPMLAEGITVGADGLTATIALRQGVPFHNGAEMVAADVIASYNRWAPVSSLGLAIAPFLNEVVEVDPYTVEFRLKNPLATLPSLLARQAQGLSIHPKSVLDAAGVNPLTDEGYIGTGPYRFVERQTDRFTRLGRFEEYASLETAPSGYAGAKAAYLDEIEFIPVPDEAARVAGLQSGEYDYLEEIIPDQIEVLQDNPDVTIEILPPRSYGVVIMNTVAGLMSNVTIRQAVQAAIAVEPTGQASHGEGYFEPGPGIMMPQTAWNSDVSAELYNQNNPEKARQLLETAGYDGTPVRLLATQEDLGDYNAAVVVQQQLEAAGFAVELEVSDEATLEENIEDDERWDMTTNAYVFRPDPVLIAAFASCAADGQWCSPEKVAAVERLQTESDFEARYAALEELQRLWYEQAPAVKLVNNYGVAALSSRVQGLLGQTHFEIEPEFANCWIEEG